TVPIYESKTILQLGGSNTAQQVLLVSSFTEEQNIGVDMHFMRSPFFISMVLDRLPLEVSYFNRGQILTEEYYKNSFFNLTEVTASS
ncbi:MAG TPA: hypothetical protein PKY96_14195, partial [Flavobacteriales bacterium]|nr:hypothetical protein [Flavobacteriales bacterium]